MFRRSLHTAKRLQRQKNYYDILQLKNDADKRAVKANYYKLSKRYHPDLNPKNEEAHKLFLEINEAYAVLGNEANRRKYDSEGTSNGGDTFGRYPKTGGSRGNTQAWHFRNRRSPRATGSASAQQQAEKMRNEKSRDEFNYNEHYAKHYETEEHRRRERVKNAHERRRAAGEESIPTKKPSDMASIWGRLWRLGIVLTGITYATQAILD